MASIAWRLGQGHALPSNAANLTVADIRNTPAYRLARSLAIRSARPGTDTSAWQREREDDLQGEWLRTFLTAADLRVGLATGEAQLSKSVKEAVEGGALLTVTEDLTGLAKSVVSSNQATRLHADSLQVLTKVFLVLQAGLEVLPAKNATNFVPYQGNVFRALSHGGRVNIRIPARASHNKWFLHWMGITDLAGKLRQDSPIVDRHCFGTHGVDIAPNPGALPGQSPWVEKDGKSCAIENRKKGAMVVGINIAVGGIDQNDYNGDLILPDAGHGHLFLGYMHPSEHQDGYLQVGFETTGPDGPSPVGKYHGFFSNEKNANPESSMGGLKKDKLGFQDYGSKTWQLTLGRIINLYKCLGNQWPRRLRALEAAFHGLCALNGERKAHIDLLTTGTALKAKAEQLFGDLKDDDSEDSASAALPPVIPTLQITDSGPLTLEAGAVPHPSSVRVLACRSQSEARYGIDNRVLTQDSRFTYRNYPIAQINNHPPGLAKDVDVFRTLSYESVVAAWKQATNLPTADEIFHLPESGLCLGCSVRVTDLADTTIRNHLVPQLKMSLNSLTRHLDRSGIVDAINKSKPPIDSVLLEASYSLASTSVQMPAAQDEAEATNRHLLPDLMEATRNFRSQTAEIPEVQLRVFRIRARMIDLHHQWAGEFRLGFTSTGPSAPTSTAAETGVITLYQWQAPPPQVTTTTTTATPAPASSPRPDGPPVTIAPVPFFYP